MFHKEDFSRREFIAAGLTAAAAAALPVPSYAGINKSTTVDGKPVNTKVALILYTLRDFLKTKEDIESTLARVKEIGYGAVEITSTNAIPNSELAKILKKNDLSAISCHASWDGLVNDPNKIIDEWKEVGCHHLVVSSLPGNYRDKGADGYAEFAKKASEVGAMLQEHGMTIGYHNHSFEFQSFDGQTGQAILREQGDPKYFTFEIDTYWVQHGGADPAQWISKVANRVPVVHMKDMAMDGSKQLFAPVGAGNLNWETILPACKQAGVEYYIVEQDTCTIDHFESITISYNNMKSWGLS